MGERKEVERLRRERDAWRAATGLSSHTPEEAGDLIDKQDERVEALEGALREMRDRMTTSYDDLVMIDKVLGGGG